MLLRILIHTPLWVWFVLAALIYVGISELRNRSATLTRLLVTPLAFCLLSLHAIVSTFGHASALFIWLAGVLLGAGIGLRTITAGTYCRAHTARIAVQGSAIPLALMLATFATRYVSGVLLAIRPEIQQHFAFMSISCGLYGLFTGASIGRVLPLRIFFGKKVATFKKLM